MASSSTPKATQQAKKKDISMYLPLYKAVIRGDWDTAKNFLHNDQDAITAEITRTSETVLHVAAGNRKATQFLKNLLDLIPPESLDTLMGSGNKTALHYAAEFGNIEAAKLLVTLNPNLPNTWCNSPTVTPLGLAAMFRHRQLTSYLFTVTEKDVGRNPFAGEPGVSLLTFLIHSEFYDMALELVRSNPTLGTLESPAGNGTPLGVIAGKSSAFLSGTHYKDWQLFIYSRVPVKIESESVWDAENPRACRPLCTKMGTVGSSRGVSFIHVLCQKFHHMIWSIMEILVPQTKNIKETKDMHGRTLELVRCLCAEISSLDEATATLRFTLPLRSAAKLGICEVVEEILESYPTACRSSDEDGHNIFHHAVINRREKVFNLLYQLSEHIRPVMWLKDTDGNTILHLAGKLAPTHRINLVSGAALQMQRELQWYKVIEFCHFVAEKIHTQEPVHFRSVSWRRVGMSRISLIISGDDFVPDQMFVGNL